MDVLALCAAKNYVPPDEEDIWERDCTNQHAIFTIQNGQLKYESGVKPDVFGLHRRKILKDFIDSIDLKHTFKIPFDMSLHDFVGVQMNTDEYPHSIFSASTLNTDTTNIMLPDFYAMKNYDGKLDDPDLMKHGHKVDRLFFIGATTGNINPLDNIRIKMCYSALQIPWFDAYISDVQQMSYTPLLNNIMHVPVSPRFQKMYRHIASIDGNTAAWDRVPWVLASNSTLWKHDSMHQCWYYPLMKPGEHYIPFTMENIESTWNSRPTAPLQAAHTFVREHLCLEKQKEYTRLVFEHIKELKEP